ncbi:MAG: hypothetical protein Q9187_003723 [Circinaria calcarea]
MASRPPHNSEVRPSPRDRTPPRFIDGRLSTSYSVPSSSRFHDGAGRSADSNGYPGFPRDFPREPPKGPKAQFDGPRGGGFPQRGRGFANRVDPRDRDTSLQRRDVPDREWRREPLENRERRPSPTGRNRSRSPVPRDFRDTRDPPPRNLDLSRARRDSREGPLSATSSATEVPSSAGLLGRGTSRSQGRGDFDPRGGGRGVLPDDRDNLRQRSRSRDRAWSRDDRSHDREWETGRREGDDRHTKEDPDRETDRWRRDAGTYRSDSRNSNGSRTGPSTPHVAPASSSSHQNTVERYGTKPSTLGIEATRRASSNITGHHVTVPGLDQCLKDDSRKGSISIRKDPYHNVYNANAPSSPPQAPQVPAFGSVAYHTIPRTATSQNVAGNLQTPSKQPVPLGPSRAEKPDPIKVAPTAPKALSGLPTAPRAGTLNRQPQHLNFGSPNHGHDHSPDSRNPSQTAAPPASSPSTMRHGNTQRSGVVGRFPQTPFAQATPSARTPDQRLAGQFTSRANHLDTSVTVGHPGIKQSNHFDLTNTMGKTPPRAPAAAGSAQGSPGGLPFGPRSTRGPVSLRTAANSAHGPFLHKTWINPNVQARHAHQPSIMNTVPPTLGPTVPAKRDYAGEARTSGSNFDQTSQLNERLATSQMQEPLTSKTDKANVEERDQAIGRCQSGIVSSPKSPEVQSAEASINGSLSKSLVEDVPMIQEIGEVPEKPDSVSEDEEVMDEAYYIEAEKKHTRDMQALEAKRPATPRHHTELLSLLEEIDALASVADDLSNGVIPHPPKFEDKLTEKLSLGLPSPKSEEADNNLVEMVDRASSEQDTSSRSSSPSISGLPYLVNGPPTPFSEIRPLQENHDNHQKFRPHVLAHVVRQRDTVASDFADMRYKFAQLYKPWKMRVDELDRQKKATYDTMHVATSPAPAISPIVPPTPLIEGRRTGRFVSELELQRVIEVSKIAAEAEENREKEAQDTQALADLEKEATIPDMLHHNDIAPSIFKDTNHLIESRMALKVLAFVPAPDDFSPEEHKLFTEQYMLYPKKWGQIAEAIPGRDYQDCIQHYYLSKKEANYKGQLSKRVGKKGRKVARGPPGRPKSNALMSDMGGRTQLYESNDFETPQLAVTDTGRPKRAAAPTFGDAVPEVDPVTPGPTPRRGPGAAKVEMTGDPGAERPTIRRTRTTVPKEKGVKRGRAPLLAAAPGPSPQKKDPDATRARSKEPKIEDGPRAKEIEETQILSSFPAVQPPSSVLPPNHFVENWLNAPPKPASQVVPGRPPSQPPPPSQHQQQQAHQEQQLQQYQQHQQQQQRSTSQTSSYWSVPEQTDFLNLIGHFGSDWQAISNHLKNKTPVMVKNYFHRTIEKGEVELEHLAAMADDKIKRGVQMGNPPQPSATTKRRYEQTPQMTPQRILAPSTEVMDLGNESPGLHSSTAFSASPSQPPSQQVGQNPPRLAPLPQSLNPSAAMVVQPVSQKAPGTTGRTQTSTHQQQRPSRQSLGPQLGYFGDNRPILQAQPSSQRQQPQQPQESASQQQHNQRPVLESREFQERLARQHMERQEQDSQLALKMIQPAAPQLAAAPQPQVNDNRQALQNRGAPSALKDVDRRPPPSIQQPISNPSPPKMRRMDSFGKGSYGEISFQPSINARNPILSPPQEPARSSSVPMNVSSQLPPPPPRPPPVPAKRSNIMSILNEEPTEPQPKKTLSESRVIAPTPPPQSPAMSIPPYRQPSQPSHRLPRREHPVEPSQPIQQSQRLPFIQPSQQLQVQQETHHPDQVSQPRESGNSWQAVIPRTMYERPMYPAQAASSPHQSAVYAQSSRSSLQQLQPPRAPSPPLPPSTHARGSSYTGLHSHQSQQQQPVPHNTGLLHRSPYSQVSQHPSQLQPHPQQPQQPQQSQQPQQPSQRSQPVFQPSHHVESLARQQLETFRHQENIHHQSLHQSDFPAQEAARHQDAILQRMRHQERYPMQQQQHEQMRREVAAPRTFTPPVYHGTYGAPRQQHGQGRGYEDMR